MDTILRGLLSEAWGRSVASYERSLEYYNTRVKDGLQPHTPYVDVFNVEQQNNFLCWANAAYLVITVILFAYMKRRASGFRLRWILVLYDGSNVVIASYIAMSILRYKLTRGGFLVCNTLANDPEGYRMSWVFALFYIQKYYEFLDTWFFILRKSSRQVQGQFLQVLPCCALLCYRNCNNYICLYCHVGDIPAPIPPFVHHRGGWIHPSLRLQRGHVLAHLAEQRQPHHALPALPACHVGAQELVGALHNQHAAAAILRDLCTEPAVLHGGPYLRLSGLR